MSFSKSISQLLGTKGVFSGLFNRQRFGKMHGDQLITEKKENKSVRLNLDLLDRPPQPCFDCLIVLNNKLQDWMLAKFISRAKVVIATDGGANHLYRSAFRDVATLHTIIGDLDSLNPQIQAYYRQRQVVITKDTDQDTNDFEKSVILARKMNLRSIVTIGVLGGRIDQQLCNLSSMEKYSWANEQRFVALGHSSLMFLIRDGEQAVIKVGKQCILNQVGLFCFGKSRVVTGGFKWNLTVDSPQLQWGRFISSSNVIMGSEVSIRSEKQMFFTVELGGGQQGQNK